MPVAQEPPPPATEGPGASALGEPSRLFLMLNSFETGGSERQFVSLAKSLDPEKFSLSLGCIQTKGPLRDLFGEVPRFKLGGSVYGWKSWHSRWQLSRHLRQKQIQIAHAFDFYTNLTLVPAARWAGVSVVIGSQRQLGDLLSPTQSRLQKAAFGLCDVVLCNSRAASERLRAGGFPISKIRIIGNALSPESFADAAPLVPRREGVLRVGMIARMNAHSKNHLGFLRAAASLHASFPEAEFLLAGDGPLRKQLEAEAASLGIGDRVRFLGDRRDIPAVLASLDVTVVPSDSESLSNVILESMAAGVPVVATGVGGNPELLAQDRGVLVPARDVDALAKAAELLMRDPAHRLELGRNAKQFAHEMFSAESITNQYQDLYQELLSQKTDTAPRREYSVPGPLRVAIIAASLRYVGGQSVQADLLLKRWAEDPRVSATFIPVDPQFPIGLRWVARLPGLRTVVRSPFYLAALWRGLRDVDVAHIFSASYSSFLVAPLPAWMVARLRKKKAVIHYHSGEARDHLRSSWIARSVLKRVDRVVTPSAYLVDVFREFGLQADPIPNLVDFTQFSYRERRPLRPHLICTRGFHRYYCVDVVVRAFAQVQKEFLDAQLDLVGGGPLESQTRQLVADLNLSSVHFCGVVSRDEIGKYYDRADIFINASKLDNMPVSVLEAFASGTPVVSTAPEGMRYLVEHGQTGLLSEPGDAPALAGNVLRLLRDPQLASRLSANGFQQLRQYRWNAVGEQWLFIYEALVPAKLLPAKKESTVESG
jgi:glycosyltransferase involved in cell wall biosynthesis